MFNFFLSYFEDNVYFKFGGIGIGTYFICWLFCQLVCMLVII